MACHTAPGGKPFAGGLVLDTPFGKLRSPNITPDAATGIGRWSDDDFYRAMHEGIGKEGEYLYPAMPFPWYTQVTRDDVLAIKAYLFSLPPVNSPRQPNEMIFPANIRESLLAWREVFFKPHDFGPDPNHSAQVNRGDYLVNGLAHCGECHNSRLLAGASRYQKALQGGVINNWYAPNITSDVRDGIGSWSQSSIATYLKTGVAPNGKGVAAGPMAEAVHSLKQLDDADLQAIAAYLKSTPPVKTNDHEASGSIAPTMAGAQIYLDNCASCHGVKGEGLKGAVPALAGNGAVVAKGPENVVQVVLGGLQAQGGLAPMLAIGAGMSDQDVSDVTNYVRQSWGNQGAQQAQAQDVAKLRSQVDTPMTAGRSTGCGDIAVPAVAQAVADPKRGVGSRLAATHEDNMPQQVQRIVASVKPAAPGVAPDALVNGLTTAYCKVVRADTHLDWNAKALELGHFAQLVYMQVSSNGMAPSRGIPSARTTARTTPENSAAAAASTPVAR